MEQRYPSRNPLRYVVYKTGLSTDIVERLGDVRMPEYWIERVTSILNNYKKPRTLALHEKMIKEREEYIKKLPADEIWEIQEIKEVDEYIVRLMNEGDVDLGTASIFASALLQWYLRVQEIIIAVLNSQENPAQINY